MRIEFPYVEEKATITETILRPFARVRMINGERSITQDMYIDSGADLSLISLSVGQALGFELKNDEEVKRIGGIGGGKISVSIRNIKMMIGNEKFDCRVAWCLSEDVPLLIGRLDIFNLFDITFKEKERKVIFTSNK